MTELTEECSNSGKPQVINDVKINAPVGQLFVNVDKVIISSKGSETQQPQPPTREQMCKIVEKMMDDGLWYAGRAWAVVFRMYQIWGYNKKYSDFVKEVAEWPFKRHKPTDCNEDAVSKPLRSGKYLDAPSTWLIKGAPKEAVRLGEAIEAELTKIQPLF